jgi:hypothetical protein
VYRYSEVPVDSFDKLLHAESKGRYFLAAVRDRFRYECLAKLHVA